MGRVDVLAMLVAYFVEIMEQDAASKADQERADALAEELMKLHEDPLRYLGSAPSEGLWNGDI
jgi:fumarate hydratase class II